jgi:LmbE family N-acetylglucosaminyl deacetylase
VTAALVISPHLDDAVLGCGAWLAAHPGSMVVTLFAGTPHDAGMLTPWDARCGFANARSAIAARREEDRRALACLGATPVWLDFCDSQYGDPPTVNELAAPLQDALRRHAPARVLYPLGLYHSDHVLTHTACRLALAAVESFVESFVYEDALYRGMPGVLQGRLAELSAQKMQATPARLAPTQAHEIAQGARAKAEAVQAYASQLRGFGPGGYEDAAQPERCWRLQECADA